MIIGYKQMHSGTRPQVEETGAGGTGSNTWKREKETKTKYFSEFLHTEKRVIVILILTSTGTSLTLKLGEMQRLLTVRLRLEPASRACRLVTHPATSQLKTNVQTR